MLVQYPSRDIRCFDGVTSIGRIKGKIKKKVWIREGDILIVVSLEFPGREVRYHYTATRGPSGGVAPEEPGYL